MVGWFDCCTIYYLEVGGSFLPNDRDFAHISNKAERTHEITLPEDWINIIKNARDPPFQICRLKQTQFFDFKELLDKKGSCLKARKNRVVCLTQQTQLHVV